MKETMSGCFYSEHSVELSMPPLYCPRPVTSAYSAHLSRLWVR